MCLMQTEEEFSWITRYVEAVVLRLRGNGEGGGNSIPELSSLSHWETVGACSWISTPTPHLLSEAPVSCSPSLREGYTVPRTPHKQTRPRSPPLKEVPLSCLLSKPSRSHTHLLSQAPQEEGEIQREGSQGRARSCPSSAPCWLERGPWSQPLPALLAQASKPRLLLTAHESLPQPPDWSAHIAQPPCLAHSYDERSRQVGGEALLPLPVWKGLVTDFPSGRQINPP